MLVVPWSHDQPDNAERLRKLGISRTISRSRYDARTVARELELLLQDSTTRQRAVELGAKIATENGLQNACDELEAALSKRQKMSFKAS
jgi:UDP:flavonoid glycosyltransferase YjiC (YdhE family)